MEKTIVACCCSLPSAIAIIRISGNKSLNLLKKIFKTNQEIEPKRVLMGIIDTLSIKDKAQAIFYKAPNSYTGEDIVELFTHGSKVLVNEILKFLTSFNDVRLADRGEFSLRAYLNNKIDLTRAEGIINLINSETILQANKAYDLLNGDLSKKVESLQEKIKVLSASVEVNLDYPEEDLEQQINNDIKSDLKSLINEIKVLKESYNRGRFIFDGIKVTLIGDVNVGKSSLLNALLNKDRAIVTEIEGTTTDIIEDFYEYKGYKFILTDTAGIRESKNKIERIGIEKSKKALQESDIILAVSEAGKEFSLDIGQKSVIYVENKIDKSTPINNSSIRVSALNNINIDKLKEEIYLRAELTENSNNEFMITNLRHYNALNSALLSLKSALSNINSVESDCIAFDLFSAFNSIGEITGQIGTETIINEIFSSFCVGK